MRANKRRLTLAKTTVAVVLYLCRRYVDALGWLSLNRVSTAQRA